MTRRAPSRRLFFGLLGAVPLAMPAALRATTEPVRNSISRSPRAPIVDAIILAGFVPRHEELQHVARLFRGAPAEAVQSELRCLTTRQQLDQTGFQANLPIADGDAA